MKISPIERDAIRHCLAFAADFGYGNLIGHLKTAWAKLLMQKYGMDEDAARKAADTDSYPLAMHDDIVERGEWDETGARYRKKIDPHTPPR